MATPEQDEKLAEQQSLARDIGRDLTDAFVAYVSGEVTFDDLTFGVFDALSDLHVIASGEYDLEDDHGHEDEDEGDEFDDEDDTYDDDEATDEQEELSQEPAN